MPVTKILFFNSFIFLILGIVCRVLGFIQSEEQYVKDSFAKFNGFEVFNVNLTINYIKKEGFKLTSIGLIFLTIAVFLTLISIVTFAVEVYLQRT